MAFIETNVSLNKHDQLINSTKVGLTPLLYVEIYHNAHLIAASHKMIDYNICHL